MADEEQQLSMGGDTESQEKTVRFDDDLLQAGFTGIPNPILLDTSLSVSARMVYLGLSYFARADEKCFPRQDTFAEHFGMSERTMRSGLRELEKAGLVQSKRRRGHSTLYTLFTPSSGNSGRYQPADTADQERQNLPESKKKQLEEESKGKKESSREDDEAIYLWHVYEAVFEPPRAKLGPKRLRGIKAALKEVDLLTFVQAIHGYKNYRAHRPGKSNIESIWATYKETGTVAERIEWLAGMAKGSAPGQKAFPSAQRAIVAQRQLDVQRGHDSTSQEVVERAKESEAWLLQHGIETARREDGYPVFRAVTGGSAS